MVTVLEHESITASLYRFWNDGFDPAVTTIYPGIKADTSALTEWVEIWVDSWARRPQRIAGVPVVDVTVVVHCFVKSGSDGGRIHELTDRVRATFAQETVPLKDFQQSGSPQIGTIRLKEPETRNLTRRTTGELKTVLHHTAVVIRGFAQADGPIA